MLKKLLNLGLYHCTDSKINIGAKVYWFKTYAILCAHLDFPKRNKMWQMLSLNQVVICSYRGNATYKKTKTLN